MQAWVCVWLKGNCQRPHIRRYTRNFPEKLDGSDYTNTATDVYIIIDWSAEYFQHLQIASASSSNPNDFSPIINDKEMGQNQKKSTFFLAKWLKQIGVYQYSWINCFLNIWWVNWLFDAALDDTEVITCWEGTEHYSFTLFSNSK